MKTIDNSLNLKIKENDARIKALINLNNSLYYSNNSNQQIKVSKISKYNHNDDILKTKNNKQTILPKTITTKDIGLLSTNPNTNSQSVSLTSLHTQIPISYNRSSITRNNTKKYKNLKYSPYNYKNSRIYKNLVSKTLHSNETLKKKLKKKNKINLNEMFERFKIDQNKKSEKLEKLKQIKEEKELKNYTHKPIINKRTQNIMSRTKTNFYKRQSELEQRKKKNEENLKQILLQEEQEKICNTSYMYQTKLKASSSKGGLSNSMISDFSSITKLKKDVSDGINRLLDWGEKKKEKLNQKISEKEYLESSGHIPTIDKRSLSLAVKKNSNQKFYLRLSKEDETIKEKNRLLAEVLKPSFKPNLNLSNYGKGVREKNDIENIDKNNNSIVDENNCEEKFNNLVLIKQCNSCRVSIGKVPKKNGQKFATISQIKENEEVNLQNTIRNIVIKNLFKQSKMAKVGSSATLEA